jgi:hypothetical protein
MHGEAGSAIIPCARVTEAEREVTKNRSGRPAGVCLSAQGMIAEPAPRNAPSFIAQLPYALLFQ